MGANITNKILQYGSHLKKKIEYKTFIVLDSQESSQIVGNMSEIERRNKKRRVGGERNEYFYF